MIVVMLTVIQLIAIRQHLDDEQYLENLMNQIASRRLPQSRQVIQVLDYLRKLPAVENSSYFLSPIFSILRPSARSVAQHGGDCADRSRLLIRLLHSRGIDAKKWALYSDDLPQHAVVEVAVEKGTMVADGLFGLWFPRSDGGYYGINELKNHPEILQQRIAYFRAINVQPGAVKLEFYPIDKYTYAHARTINWNKSIFGQQLYKGLRLVFGETIDGITRPYFVEAPGLMVVYTIGALQALIVLIWIAMIPSTSRCFRSTAQT